MKILTALVAALLVLSGCTILPGGGITQGLTAEQITALGQDKASVCLRIAYGPGSLSYARTMPGMDIACNSEGLTTKQPGGGVMLPLTVTPEIQVNPPTLKR